MQPESRKARLTRQWLVKSSHDLLMADKAVTPPAALDAAVFHCQQAAEKVLKGYLTWHDRPFRRTHDLLQLLGQCAEGDPGFGNWHEAARVLTPYVSEFRYPSDLDEPSAEEAALARQLAGDLVEFVKSRLPPEAQP